MEFNLNFKDSNEELIFFIAALEKKFEIVNEDKFEDEMLKLIKEGVDSYQKSVLDIDEFENSFFDLISSYSSNNIEENLEGLKNEISFMKENSDGERDRYNTEE